MTFEVLWWSPETPFVVASLSAMSIESWLHQFIGAHRGIAGSVHVLEDGSLSLRAAANIPPPVIEATRKIARGKGMAGLAWDRNTPVTTCNLKTDSSGDVRPGAKAVDAQAAVAIPVRDIAGEVCAVVGIAFLGERDFSEDELERLERAAAEVPLS